MSNLIFPPLSAPQPVRLLWGNVRTPIFKTAVAEASNGLEATASRWAYPRWRWICTWTLTQAGHEIGDQLRPVVGHFMIHRGRGDTFLFQDREDFQLDQQIGVGNGAIKHFQLVRTYGGFVEPITEVKAGTLVVKVNNVTQTAGVDYSESQGLIMFAAAPANGLPVTAACEFYFRVRFKEDLQDFDNFTYRLHRMREVELLSKKRTP